MEETPISQGEAWDLLDSRRQPLGRVMFRGQPIPDHTFHVCVETWTVSADHHILLTLRHPDKDLYPNCWECTGGSLISGETSREGAVRELREETGIIARPEELRLLGTTLIWNCIFFDTYILRRDVDIGDIRLQQEETVAARWVTGAELDQLLKEGRVAAPIATRLRRYRAAFDLFLYSREGEA